MTPKRLQQLDAPPAAHNICNHPRLSLGLDSGYCPDCKSEFKPRSKEYQNALYPPQPVYPAVEYKVGDRVSILREPPQAVYQIVKLGADGHATVEALVKGPGCSSRRVALWKLMRPSCALPEPDDQAEQLLSGATHEQTVDPNAPPAEATQKQECSCVTSKPPTHEQTVDPNAPPAEATHEHCWVQKYWVRRGNTKHEYFRFCYQPDPTNISSCVRIHIPGGNVRSPKAQDNMADVEIAIAIGKSFSDIVQLIKSWRKQS